MNNGNKICASRPHHAALMLGAMLSLAWSLPVLAAPYICTVDLVSNSTTCTDPAISFVMPPSGGQTVMKITLDPAASPPRTSAKFRVCYNAPPTGYTVNIGDSSTNNGFGGDAATQSNDAETQVVGRDLTVFGNDLLTVHKDMLNIKNFAPVASGCKVLQVSDNQLVALTNTTLKSPDLYALAGQPDTEGPVNYDIYAGFNTVIDVGSGRTGTGVSFVTITLLP